MIFNLLAPMNYWEEMSVNAENAEILKENIALLDKILKPIFSQLEGELAKYPNDYYFTKFKNELIEAQKIVKKDWTTWEDWDKAVQLLVVASESAPYPFQNCIPFC